MNADRSVILDATHHVQHLETSVRYFVSPRHSIYFILHYKATTDVARLNLNVFFDINCSYEWKKDDQMFINRLACFSSCLPTVTWVQGEVFREKNIILLGKKQKRKKVKARRMGGKKGRKGVKVCSCRSGGHTA